MYAHVRLGGMTCSGCVASVENSIRKIDGVKEVRVDLDESSAYIVYENDSNKNILKNIALSILKSGYQVITDSITVMTENLSNHPGIERKIEQIDGVVRAEVFMDEIEIEYISRSFEDLRRDIEKLGIKVLKVVKDLPSYESGKMKRDFLISLPPALYFILRMFLHYDLKYLDFAVCSFVIPIAYRRFAKGFFRKLISFSADMNVLVAIGVFSAYIFSLIETFLPNFLPGDFLFYETSAIITSVVLFGRYIENSVRGKTYEALKKLGDMEPKTAVVLKDGKESVVDTSDLALGDIVVCKEGTRIPVDGVVINGRLKVDESHITGNLEAVEKEGGEKVFCGSLVIGGWGLIRVEGSGEQTVLRKMISSIKASRFKKTSAERLADRVSYFFVPTVIFISVLAFSFWFFYDFAFAIERAISVLVVSCPCALGLATPTALVSALGKSSKYGIIVKNASVFENISHLKNVIFDKTGTLTRGKMKVKDILIFDNSYSKEKFLELLASSECFSEHIIARSILEYAHDVSIKAPENFFSLKGKGVYAKVDGIEVIVGNEKILKDFSLEVPKIERHKGLLEIFVFLQKKFVGMVLLEEELDQNSFEVVNFLKERKKNLYILTGDTSESNIGEKLKIDKVFSGLLPDEKIEVLEKIRKEKGKVAMIGDGINDAPVLSLADVGIAVGSASDISKMAADVVVQSLKHIPLLFKISDYVVKVIKMNLFWAFIYNIVLIPIAAGIFTKLYINPMLAALSMSFSSILVVLNSLTILSKKF